MKQLLFSFYRLHHMLFLYLSLSILHCLDSVREHVGRTLSNAFTVGVDKLFDALNTSNQLTDHATCIKFCLLRTCESFPWALPALSVALLVIVIVL